MSAWSRLLDAEVLTLDEVSGIISATLNYSATQTLAATVTINYPPSCVMGMACAQLSGYLQGEFSPTAGIQSTSCSGTSTCACTFVETQRTLSQAGTYIINGNTVALTPTTGIGSGIGYCIQGSTLHFVSVDPTMNMGPMGKPTIYHDIVATKQ